MRSPDTKDPWTVHCPVLLSLQISQTQDTPAVYPQIGKMRKPFTDQAIDEMSRHTNKTKNLAQK